MNLHEQCLLKYLKNPDALYYTTEILKINNKIMENKFVLKNIVARVKSFTYTNNAS